MLPELMENVESKLCVQEYEAIKKECSSLVDGVVGKLYVHSFLTYL
jgi:hypothetical protein